MHNPPDGKSQLVEGQNLVNVQVRELERRMLDLHGRLSPVLRKAEEKAPTISESEPRQNLAPVASELQGTARKLAALNAYAARLLDLLEV